MPKAIYPNSRVQNLESSDGSLARYIPLKQKLNTAAADFYKAVEKLESTGVLVKSIEDGLLDFPRNGTVRRFGCAGRPERMV